MDFRVCAGGQRVERDFPAFRAPPQRASPRDPGHPPRPMGATLSITVRTEHMDFDGGDHLLIGAMLLRNLHLDFTPNELRISSLHS